MAHTRRKHDRRKIDIAGRKHDSLGKCPQSGKIRLPGRKEIWLSVASEMARRMNRNGDYFSSLYCYVCEHCGSHHLTRMSEFQGKPMELVLKAADKEIQDWAMGKTDE